MSKNLTKADNLEDVPALLLKVRDEIKKISNSTGNCSLLDPLIDGIDVSKSTDVEELIRLKGAIEISASTFNKTLSLMNKTNKFNLISLPPKWTKNKADEEVWQNFIDDRILEICHKEKLEKLRAVEKELAQFETQEQKFKNAFSNIQELLTN